jgi:serine/threonine protein kinase
MFGKKKLHANGYTSSVDWWSLGVTMYKLLFGREPYATTTYSALSRSLPRIINQSIDFFEAFTKVFGKLTFEEVVDPTTEDLIRKLLNFEADHRLGSGPNGVLNVRNHPFFASIDWVLIESGKAIPPYHPTYETLSILQRNANGQNSDSAKKYSEGLPSILASLGKSEWIDSAADYPPEPGSNIRNKFTFRFPSVASSSNKTTTSRLTPGSSIAASQRPSNNGTVNSTAHDATRSKFAVNPLDEIYFRGWAYVSTEAIEAELIAEEKTKKTDIN